LKKTITIIEQRRRHKHDKNESECNQLRNLVNRKVKKDKEEWFGQYCEKLHTCLTEEILKNHTTLLESFLETPK
jgi:hypothetical protein